MTKEVYYRVRDSFGGVYYTEHEVLKRTPAGVWVEDIPGIKKFVLENAAKKFAHPTKEKALESFKRRKARQIRILTAQLENVRDALSCAEKSTPENLHCYATHMELDFE
jgi:hypothetical protein